MAQVKTNAQRKAEAFIAKSKATAAPDLHGALIQAGDMKQLSDATGISRYSIQQAARGVKELDTKNQAKLDAYLKGEPIPKGNTNPFTPPAPVAIPPWDKKMVSIKIVNKTSGKKQTLKLPALIARLFEMHGNVKNDVGRAMGYSGWNTVQGALDGGKYEARIHPRAYAAVNGLPLPNGKGHSESVQDNYTLGLAICLVGMNEFEHLEEIAEIMGGTLVFKMTAGNAGWWAIYRIAHRDKLEKFKRLASRDAKKIVCP